MAAENKTTRTKAGVGAFITKIKDPKRRGECQALVKLMEEASGERAAMWGTSIVGFGTYHYRGRSGREGDWFITGFSPRVQALTIYIMPGVESFPALMRSLGKYTTGKSCIYVKKLEDIQLPTLKKLVQASFKELKRLGYRIEAE
jgi:hypothetical protein